jgi:hypothetical protein
MSDEESLNKLKSRIQHPVYLLQELLFVVTLVSWKMISALKVESGEEIVRALIATLHAYAITTQKELQRLFLDPKNLT